MNWTNHVSQNLLNDTTGANRCHTPRNSMAERRVDCQKRALSDRLVPTRANSCQVHRKKTTNYCVGVYSAETVSIVAVHSVFQPMLIRTKMAA